MRTVRQDVGRRSAVAVVAWLFAAVLLGGTVPSPLYPFYVDALGLTPFLVTVVSAVYALGTLAALLPFGGWAPRSPSGSVAPSPPDRATG